MQDHIPFAKYIRVENNAVVHFDCISPDIYLFSVGHPEAMDADCLSESLYPEQTRLKLYIDLLAPSLVSDMLDWSTGTRQLINK